MAIPIQDQVVPLAESKRLKELGVKQESYFTWVNSPVRGMVCGIKNEMTDMLENFSAFSVAELGIMIGGGYYTFPHDDGSFACYKFGAYMGDTMLLKSDFPTEAQSRAALLIHLIENKILSVDEVNKRLAA